MACICCERSGRDGDIIATVTGGSISTAGTGSRALYLGQEADSGSSGQTIRLRVLVSNASVTSAQAEAVFIANDEGRDAKRLTLRNATIERTNATGAQNAVFFSQSGPTNSSAAADEVVILGGPAGAQATRIKGRVEMNYGNDTLVLNTCTAADRAAASVGDDCHESPESGDLVFLHENGSFAGLHSAAKTGSGLAKVHDLDLSQSNTPLALKDGSLLIKGHLNLGTGALTIHDTSRLVFASTPDEHGRVTASKGAVRRRRGREDLLGGRLELGGERRSARDRHGAVQGSHRCGRQSRPA